MMTTIVAWARQARPQRVLDVGPGDGSLARALVADAHVERVDVLDISTSVTNLETSKIAPRLGDIAADDTLAWVRGEQFDAIVVLDLLCLFPPQTVARVLGGLATAGASTIFLSFWRENDRPLPAGGPDQPGIVVQFVPSRSDLEITVNTCFPAPAWTTTIEEYRFEPPAASPVHFNLADQPTHYFVCVTSSDAGLY
jgi:SAM-dependent methyltransferase